jgi:hypothetical protein
MHIISKYTSPPTALGFWFALEECTLENGALSFLPGSHLTTPITKRFVRLPTGGTGFEKLPSKTQIEHEQEGNYIMEACAPGMFLSCVYLIIFILPFNPSLNKR